MKFSWVIPNINQDTMLFDCIESLWKFNGYVHEVIVVDDGSKPEVKEKIQAFVDLHTKYPAAKKLRFISNDINQGFSKTVNIGIRQATGDVIILVNNDVVFTDHILSYLQEDLERDKTIGVVGALLFYPDGTIQHGGIAKNGSYGFTHFGWHQRLEHAHDVKTQYTIGVTGAVFAVRRETLDEVGLFDESFFLASEDTQYCLRTWKAGWKVYFDTNIRAIHKEGATRGATVGEKLTKSKQTREWFLKENQTATKFADWLKNVDVESIQRQVDYANGKPVPQPVASFRSKSGFTKKIIGVRRAGAFGDVLLATPVLRELKIRYPDFDIHFATQSPAALANNPNVSRVVSDIGELKDAHTVYDLDLVYESNPKMHATDAYSLKVFGEPSFSKTLDLYSDSSDFDSLHKHIAGTINFERDVVVVMHMATSWVNRTWPLQNWKTLVRSVVQRGHKVVVVGQGGDFKIEPMAGVVSLNDRLTIPEVRELIKRADVFVGPDSGLLHVAQTTSTPCVAMFTVAEPEFRITRHENTFVLIPKSLCRGCLHDAPPPVTFIGCKLNTNQCVKEITPMDVDKAVEIVRRKR